MTRARKIKCTIGGLVMAVLAVGAGVYFYYTPSRELQLDALAVATRYAILDAEKTNVGPDGLPLDYGYLLEPVYQFHSPFSQFIDTLLGRGNPVVGDMFGDDWIQFDSPELRSRIGDIGVDLLIMKMDGDRQYPDDVEWFVIDSDPGGTIYCRGDTEQEIMPVSPELVRCYRYSAIVAIYCGDGIAFIDLTRRPGQPWQIANVVQMAAPRNSASPTATQPTSGPADGE